MKPDTERLDVESTLAANGAETVAMRLDANATAHLMDVLTKLYSDTETAVLREYATNARDANVAAGNDSPVRVQTPSALAPFVRISDDGTGLSAADIRDVFSSYGTSTKRSDNDSVGMLGLGCKSALAYADSFTVSSVKDGRAISVLVARDEDGAGSMSIVSDQATDAPNGTEIIVPAKSGHSFETKASAFFAYWPEGTVLVNGNPPARVDGLQLSPRVLLAPSAYGNTDNVVVMGGVPYPFLDDVDVPQFGTSSERRRIVAFVDIGEVTFVPSREGLAPSKRTRAALAAIVAEVVALRDAAVRKSIADAPTPTVARAALAEGRLLGFRDDSVRYKGREILQRLDRTPRNPDGSPSYAIDERDTPHSFLVHHVHARRGRTNGERTWTLDLDSGVDANTDVFVGFSSKSLSPTKRDKLQLWRANRGSENARAIFTDTIPAAERYWLPEGTTFHDWNDVDSLKLPRVPRADGTTGRPRGSYSVSVDGAYPDDTPADSLDGSRPIYWTNGNAYSVREHPAIRSGAVDVAYAFVVALPANRVDKFLRDFPAAIALDTAAKDAAAKWTEGLAADMLRAWRLQRDGNADTLRAMDAADVNDPQLAAAIVDAKRDTRRVSEGLKRFRYYATIPEGTRTPNALAPYPLLDFVRGSTKLSGDMILYANAKYAASIGDAADATSDRTSGKGDA